ncbi:MAG: BatA domain-containing protein [Fuerstiella sp.]|nr:BatA domain-containing protein [Fuerstiella sp.]
MTFLQPFLLFALPLIGLPVLIHLVNQNRHRTVHWGATMFLVQAKRMARGMARLRYLLILVSRMLAIAGLIFAISRPMTGGWLGLTAGGAPETTLVLLDRSVSMEAHDPSTRRSKRETALQKLSELIQNTGRNTELVLFDSVSLTHRTVRSPADLLELPQTGPSDTAADIPGLLQQATEYIDGNETGRTDVWICSDLRKSDWDASGGRWEVIRRQLEQREGLRMYLLSYSDEIEDNLAVSVSGVHRRETSDGAELLMDIRVNRNADSGLAANVPLSVVIDGARSALNISVSGSEFVRNGHAIAIDRESTSGWGRIELPEDSNPADNIYRFVYAESPVQKTVVVSDTAGSGEYLRLAAGTTSDRSQLAEAKLLTPDQVELIDWKQTALLIWQAPLPENQVSGQLREFVESGRCVIFFPPEIPTSKELYGCRWTAWKSNDVPLKINRWRTETGLLSNTGSGMPLPLGELNFYRHCGLESVRVNVLGSLDGGDSLLLRAFSDRGAVYYCTSLPGTRNSTFIDNGVVFYVMIQRALARGTAALGNAQHLDCGTLGEFEGNNWQPLDDLSERVLVSARSSRAGLYSIDHTRYALNRPLSEDSSQIITDETVASLFHGLDFTRLDDSAGSTSALASEVWRMFLVLMIVALMAESLLCLPDRRTGSGKTNAVADFVSTR